MQPGAHAPACTLQQVRPCAPTRTQSRWGTSGVAAARATCEHGEVRAEMWTHCKMKPWGCANRQPVLLVRLGRGREGGCLLLLVNQRGVPMHALQGFGAFCFSALVNYPRFLVEAAIKGSVINQLGGSLDPHKAHTHAGGNQGPQEVPTDLGVMSISSSSSSLSSLLSPCPFVWGPCFACCRRCCANSCAACVAAAPCN